MLLRPIFAGLLAVAQVPEPSPPAGDAAIQWRAPAPCPDRGALLRGIETRLGRPLRAGELGIEGVVTVHATPPLFRLQLRLRAGSPGEWRSLSAATCAALADATAVLAVSAIEARPVAPAVPAGVTLEPVRGRGATPARRTDDPPAGTTAATDVATDAEPVPDAPEIAAEPDLAGESAPEAAPEAPDVPVSAPRIAEDREPDPFVPETPPPPPPAPRRGPGGFVRVQAGPEYGALPGVTGAVGLAGGLLWRRARLELGGTYLAPRTAVSADGGLRASLVAAAVHGCGRVGRGRIEVPLCGGLELGGRRGAARDVPEARTTTVLWLSAVVGAGVAVRLGERWSLWGALQLGVSVVRQRFQVRDPGPAVSLFESRPVSGRLLLGVELRLRDPR
jgi:hypothetical protein